MHRLSAQFVLAYHGCDSRVATELLDGRPFKQSTNDYDWLGSGVYFWEVNPQRGLDFAREVSQRRDSAIGNPAVVGAVLDLGLCLDLMTKNGIDIVARAYDSLAKTMQLTGAALPKNSADLSRRRLDRAVIEYTHQMLKSQNLSFDTVRGIFVEGERVYPTAGFHHKTHSQIAVRNLDCIKGVFRVPANQLQAWDDA